MRLCITEREPGDDGITNLMEYLILSGILLFLMVVMMFTANAVFMEGPADTLRYHAFVDIGNGISSRIVDLYVIAPNNGTISTKFDIPDDVAGGDYFVEVAMEGTDQQVQVSSGDIRSTVSIAGIGATKGVTGNTTGAGWNVIQYDSKGF